MPRAYPGTAGPSPPRIPRPPVRTRYPSAIATAERDQRARQEGAPSLRALVERHQGDIKAAVARHHGRRVRLFGSVARGQERDGSDIDLLVDFSRESSLFDLLHLNRELEELLRRPVDGVSRGGLKARDQEILDEAIDL